MAVHGDWVAGLAKSVVQGLTEDGQMDLTTARLGELEDKVCQLMDRISSEALASLLTEQAEHTEVQTCPTCQTPLINPRREKKSLLFGRGEVHWHQPVSTCPRCRRDFFPSGGHFGD